MRLTHHSLWEYQLSQWRWNLTPKRKFSVRQLREHAAMTGGGHMRAKLSIIAAQGGAAKFAVVDDDGTVVEFEFATAAEAIAAHNALARAKITAPQRRWTRNADHH